MSLGPLTAKGNFILGGPDDGLEFKPKSFKINYESLAGPNSGRSLAGDMKIDWVYRNIRTFEITMPPMSDAQIRTLLSRVQGKEYQLTYYDPITTNVRTAGVYTSTSSADCYSGVLYNGLWQNVTFKAIEMVGES